MVNRLEVIKPFENALDKFNDEAYIWLRKNKEELSQKQIDDIMAILNVNSSKLQAILLDFAIPTRKG